MFAIFLHQDVHIWLPLLPYILDPEIWTCSLSNIRRNFYFNFTTGRWDFYSEPYTKTFFPNIKVIFTTEHNPLNHLLLILNQTSRALTSVSKWNALFRLMFYQKRSNIRTVDPNDPMVCCIILVSFHKWLSKNKIWCNVFKFNSFKINM